jgi:hypothetical protein
MLVIVMWDWIKIVLIAAAMLILTVRAHAAPRPVLRKLHLVRPDLIRLPFPLEVYC